MASRRPRRRLSRSAEFDRVYREGRAHPGPHLVVHSFPREDEDPPRLGLSVGRKVGGAVERNRVKRLLREGFWGLTEELPAGHDFVVVARAEAAALEGEAAVREELRDLIAAAAGAARRPAA